MSDIVKEAEPHTFETKLANKNGSLEKNLKKHRKKEPFNMGHRQYYQANMLVVSLAVCRSRVMI